MGPAAGSSSQARGTMSWGRRLLDIRSSLMSKSAHSFQRSGRSIAVADRASSGGTVSVATTYGLSPQEWWPPTNSTCRSVSVQGPASEPGLKYSSRHPAKHGVSPVGVPDDVSMCPGRVYSCGDRRLLPALADPLPAGASPCDGTTSGPPVTPPGRQAPGPHIPAWTCCSGRPASG